MTALEQYLQKKFTFDASYFLRGGGLLLFAQGATILTSLAVAVLFAKYLTKTDYGTYRYIISVGVFLGSFGLTGASTALFQAIAEKKYSFLHQAFSQSVLWSGGIIASALIVSIYYYSNDNIPLALGCLLIALFQPSSQLFLHAISIFYGGKKFIIGSTAQAIRSSLIAGVSVVSLFLTHNILILLLVYFTNQAVTAWVLYIYAKYTLQHHVKEKNDQEDNSKLLTFAKHTSIRNFILGIATRIDMLLIFQFIGAAQLAIYSIATLLPQQIRGSFKNLQTLLIPKLLQRDLQYNPKKLYKRSIQFGLLLILLSIIVIVLVPLLYPILFPSYPEAILYAQLLALSFPASIFHIPLSILQAQKEDTKLYIYNISTSIIQLLLLIPLIYFFGIFGAVCARVIIEYLKTILCFILLKI